MNLYRVNNYAVSTQYVKYRKSFKINNLAVITRVIVNLIVIHLYRENDFEKVLNIQALSKIAR